MRWKKAYKFQTDGLRYFNVISCGIERRYLLRTIGTRQNRTPNPNMHVHTIYQNHPVYKIYLHSQNSTHSLHTHITTCIQIYYQKVYDFAWNENKNKCRHVATALWLLKQQNPTHIPNISAHVKYNIKSLRPQKQKQKTYKY